MAEKQIQLETEERHVLLGDSVPPAMSNPNLAGIICYWCKKKLALITEQDAGGQPLSFCSSTCINAYKMSVFKQETEALLRSTPTLPPDTPIKSEATTPPPTATRPATRSATNKVTLPRTTRKRSAYPRPHPYYALNKKYWQNLKSNGLNAPQSAKATTNSAERLTSTPAVSVSAPKTPNSRPATASVSWQNAKPDLPILPSPAFTERYLPLSPRPPNHCVPPLAPPLAPPPPTTLSLLPPPTILAPYPFMIPVPFPFPVPIPIPIHRKVNDSNGSNGSKNGKTGFSIDQLIHKFKKQD